MSKHIIITRLFVCYIALFFIINIAKAEDIDSNIDSNIDTLHQQSGFNWTEQIIPVSLIAAGAGLCFGDIKYDLQKEFPRTDCWADNILFAVPTAEMYLFDIMGIESKNDWFDQTKYLAIAHIANQAVVNIVKVSCNIERPDSSNNSSFPSGHTSTAFVCATALYHEYKDSNPYIAYSGFFFATATGMLRITNSKHWVPDVLAGAGIGILITNLVYYIEPMKEWRPLDNKDLTINCAYTGTGFALNVAF